MINKMEFWLVQSMGLCKKCGKKDCPGVKPGVSCGATKLQIHKFQNGELLNLVKQHADNADTNANAAGADDQGGEYESVEFDNGAEGYPHTHSTPGVMDLHHCHQEVPG